MKNAQTDASKHWAAGPRAQQIRDRARRDANGYATALMAKGWTREQAENHGLVSRLRLVSITYATHNRDGRIVIVTVPEN